MKKLLLIFTITLIIISCNSEKNMSNQIIEDIRIGEIPYLQSTYGPILYDSKSRLSNRVYEHIKAKSWGYLSLEERITYPKTLFHIPQNIKSVEYIKEWTTETDLLIVKPFDEVYYNSNDYLKDIYNNYENFKKSVLDNAKQYEKFEINETLQLARYSEKFQEKRFSYRVETINEIEILEICLYNLNGDWKVGALFKK